MKWLLVAFGALMIVMGGSSVISGYPIIMVERGWSLVIAGASVFSAGAVILALALVAARVENLTRVFSVGMAVQTAAVSRREPAEAASVRPEPEADQERPESAAEPVFVPETPEAAPAPPSPAPERKKPAFLKRDPRPAPGRAADLEATAALLSAPTRQSAIEAAGAENPVSPEPAAMEAAAPAQSAPQDVAQPAVAPPPIPEPAADAPAEPAPEPRFRRFPLRSLTLPRGPWPDPPPAPAQAASEHRAAEDWFDRALSGVEEAGQPEVEALADPLPALETKGPTAPEEPVLADSVAQDAPAQVYAAAPEPEGADLAASDTLTVIGRYESEGTTYIMYSDGSIDAQTAAGLYRFESLAHLKAHIESQR